ARLYDALGCHLNDRGARFSVWAPNASSVSVIGDFNGWNAGAHPLEPRPDGSGLWDGEIPGVARGQAYKYRIVSAHNGAILEKADPVGFYSEVPPRTASRAWSLEYEWRDQAWMADRARHNGLAAPMSMYEVHLGSLPRD